MEAQDKVFWHGAFFEALQLEFHQYLNALDFEDEHQLSKEALIMDVLIIKKKPGERIDKNIGRIFKTYNVFEFKSEKDSLTEQDYNKVVAYALLYSSFTCAPVSDITVSFAVTIHPRELFKYLEKERGFAIQVVEDGIYYIEGDTFPVQIMESKRMSPEENIFIRNLRSNLQVEDAAKTAEAYKKIKPYEMKNVYLDRLIQANHNAFMEVVALGDGFKNLILEISEQDWFREAYEQYVKRREAEEAEQQLMGVAKKLLKMGINVEQVTEATELPYETVVSLV